MSSLAQKVREQVINDHLNSKKRIRYFCMLFLVQFFLASFLINQTQQITYLFMILVFLLPWWIYDCWILPVFQEQVTYLMTVPKYRLAALPFYRVKNIMSWTASLGLLLLHIVFFFLSCFVFLKV